MLPCGRAEYLPTCTEAPPLKPNFLNAALILLLNSV